MGFEETARKLKMTGQLASFEEIEGQVAEFELILKAHGIVIQPGSDLEAACLSVTDVLGKHQSPELRDPHEDIFERQKSLPAFLAFCQTSTSNVTAHGPVPSLVSTLVLGKFASCDSHMPVFEQINLALHERQKWGQTGELI